MDTSADTTVVADPNDDYVGAYFASLTEREKVGFRVAQEQLGVTFDVVKTHGFLAWKASRKRKATS